jgi:hypothetical protein
MDTFSVILEDVQPAADNMVRQFVSNNRRVKTIEANDLNDAWLIARTMYYLQKIDGPDTQIVDIKIGEIVLQEEAITTGESQEEAITTGESNGRSETE